MSEKGHGEASHGGGGDHGHGKGGDMSRREFLEATLLALPTMMRKIFNAEGVANFVKGLGMIMFNFIAGPFRRRGGGGGGHGGGHGGGGGHH